MFELELWELLSYVVTVVGFPLAIAVFVLEQRRDRVQEEEEIHQRLSDEYTAFVKLVLENADLGLLQRGRSPAGLTEEQRERRFALFNILVALFERAYLLVYEERMSQQTARMWGSWEDFMREWCRRPEFRADLPEILHGEDPAFARHIGEMAAAESRSSAASR
ncbi:MAG: hypothetical protein AB7O97_22105 [Planctomycetota bacterium]